MDFSLNLLVPVMRVSSEMRRQQRSFAFGGDEAVCEPRMYEWGRELGLARTSALPGFLMKHVPASHRSLALEVVYVVGWLQDLERAAFDGAPADNLHSLLRFQLAETDRWVVVFTHDDDGVGLALEGGVDDVIDGLRRAVANRPRRGFVFVHTPPAVPQGPYR